MKKVNNDPKNKPVITKRQGKSGKQNTGFNEFEKK